MSSTTKVVYLMRGLPSCGKSHAARKLAGASGVVLETDQYFYYQVGEDTTSYDYREELLPQARDWNFNRFTRAIAAGDSPIVVDRGNGRNEETRRYVMLAIENAYHVELREPTSPWWQEIRVLLKYKHLTGPALDQWSEQLASKSRESHRVPASTIRRWMQSWKWDLTIDEITTHVE